MTSPWVGKAVLVTGGSSGLGKAIAAEFARRGAGVMIAARGQEALDVAAAEIRAASNATVATIVADITRQMDVERMIAEALKQFGRLDVLVNNAGRSSRGELRHTTEDDLSAMLALNVIGLARCTRAALAPLLAARGSVVNIGSLAAKAASRYMGPYAASKHAVAAYSQQLRLELAAEGLHVLLVCPGPIAGSKPRDYSPEELARLPASARKPGAGVKVGRISPTKLAAKIVTACERRKPELVVPAKARLLFAIAQLSPRLGDWLINKLT